MTPRTRDLLVVAGLALAVALVFGRAVTFDFVEMDDRSYVIDNPHVRGGPTPANVAWAFTTFHQANWHPLTWVSLQLDQALGDGKPGFFHATSLVLHAAAAALLYLALNAMTGCWGRSLAVALLFAIHPLRAESVAWISERKDVLSQAFGFASVWAWTGWVRVPSTKKYAAALGLFALALLAKPMMVTLPFLLLLLDKWPFERFELVPRLREKLPFFTLSAASAIVTLVAQTHGGAVVELTRLPLGTRLANAAVVTVQYLLSTFWPVGLAVPYPYDPSALTSARVLLSLVVLVTLTAWAIRSWNRKPHVSVGWLWYLVTLLPVLGIIQVGAQSMADRYTYLPWIGPLIAIVWEIGDRIRVRAIAWSVLGVLGAASAFATVRQVSYWKDTETLVRHTLAVTGPNATARLTLGLALARSGRAEEGIPEIRKAIEISPRYTEAWISLGEALVASERSDEAIDAFRHTLTLDATNTVARSKAAALLGTDAIRRMREGDTEGAERALREAVAMVPGDAAVHGALGVALARAGKVDEAERELSEALRIDPGNAGYLSNLQRIRSMR